MRYILEYLYKGDFLCPKDEETEFKAAAEFLQLEGLYSNRPKQTVKQEPSTSQREETVTLQEPIVIADDSDSSNIEPNQKDTHPRKKIKLNSTASTCSARPRRRFVISDSSSSDEELEDSLDILIREAKQRSATRDKNERDNSFKEQSKKLMNIIRSQKNKMNTIPESTADSSLVLLESPPSIIEIYEESVPVQQEDLGSSETLMIHTDATQNSPNVEPSQRPCRNEQPEAETIPPNIEEETRPPKRGFWRTRHNSKKFGRNFCAICYKSRRGIKRHIKLNHRHLTRKPYFRCSRCLRNFYYESVYEYHKENGCNRE